MIYGLEVRTQRDIREHAPNDLIGEISIAPAGNVILRIGRENGPGEGWHQIAHVVLTPDEANRFGHEILDQAGAGLERQRARQSGR